MAVVRISPRVNMGQLLASQINIENPDGNQYLYSGIDPVAANPGIRYNETTAKWQFSHNGTTWLNLASGSGGGGAGGDGVPTYIMVQGTTLTGDFNLSDGVNWAQDKSLIKTIIVETVSTDWDLYILQNDQSFATNNANIPAMQLMSSGNGDEIINRDFPYEDEDASLEVHLYFVDNAASNTADITVVAYALQ